MLGTNIMHIEPEKAIGLGCRHLEICRKNLADPLAAQQETFKLLEDLKGAIETCGEGVSYSIHLPLVLGTYDQHVFSSFFLDEDPLLRESAFELIEVNLKALTGEAGLKPSFYVTHFSGIYGQNPDEPFDDEGTFKVRLHKVLSRLNALCHQYDVTLLLEYFGFNSHMLLPSQWLPVLEYPHLGILVDTGHLYFSAQIHGKALGMSYEALLEEFVPMASAFHVWNTKGEDGVYEESPSYMQYHHMAPFAYQCKEKGYAIDMESTMKLLLESGKPVIVEASKRYTGRDEHQSDQVIAASLGQWVVPR